MDDLKVAVILSGPAKVDGRWRKAGETVVVADTVLGQLIASNVVDEEMLTAAAAAQEAPLGIDILTSADFDKAVAASVAEREALWSNAFDHFETMAEDRLAAAVDALKAEHLAEIQSVEGRWSETEVSRGNDLTEARQRITTLETELAAAKVLADAEKAESGAGSKTTKKA